MSRHNTYNDLRKIALGLVKEEIYCNWMLPKETRNFPPIAPGITMLTEIDQLIESTKDIGMIFEYKANTFDEDNEGRLIFSTFHTLTCKEALQVGEMYLRYTGFLHTYRELEIPHS